MDIAAWNRAVQVERVELKSIMETVPSSGTIL